MTSRRQADGDDRRKLCEGLLGERQRINQDVSPPSAATAWALVSESMRSSQTCQRQIPGTTSSVASAVARGSLIGVSRVSRVFAVFADNRLGYATAGSWGMTAMCPDRPSRKPRYQR